MQPIQITLRDLPGSPVLENLIRKKAEKLNRLCRKINNCHVVVEMPQKHKRNGKLFCVHIDLTVPGKEIVVNSKEDQNVYAVIRDAFCALERQLLDYSRIIRGDIKTH